MPPAKQRIVWQLSIVIFILLLLMKKIQEKSFRKDSFEISIIVGETVKVMDILDKDRLKEYRLKLGITKQEAAKRMQISQPAYLRYEAGSRNPSIQLISKMAEFF